MKYVHISGMHSLLSFRFILPVILLDCMVSTLGFIEAPPYWFPPWFPITWSERKCPHLLGLGSCSLCKAIEHGNGLDNYFFDGVCGTFWYQLLLWMERAWMAASAWWNLRYCPHRRSSEAQLSWPQVRLLMQIPSLELLTFSALPQCPELLRITDSICHPCFSLS